jgi:hypothetical protein
MILDDAEINFPLKVIGSHIMVATDAEGVI